MTTRYRHAGFALLRSTTDPGDLDIPAGLDPADPDAVQGEGRAWLAKLWARGDARDALALASPDLAGRVAQLLATGEADVRNLRRAIMTTASYVLRWQRRVTPFGLFAGVLPATVTTGEDATTARISTADRAVARPDAGWLAALADTMERDPDLRARLTVVADSTAIVRDGRLIVARRAPPDCATLGPPSEASVRRTGPVKAAVELAAAPIRLRELAGRIGDRFPAADEARIAAMLDGLADGGFLITSLRPPMTSDDPLTCMLRALRSAGAGQAGGFVLQQRRLRQLASRMRACDPGHAEIAARMRELVPAARNPLAVDVRLDGDVALPWQVAEEAEAAAGVLLRLTTRPFGSMAWLEYHARFRERYGPGALVPVRDLVADSGLGYPDGYLGTRRARPAHRLLTERDAALLAMIQEAGTGEITLTEDRIRSLVIDDQAAMVPPERVELGVTLHAASLAAAARGDFELRVTAAPRVPTSMAGRFAHLLTRAERDRLAATYPAAGPDVMLVQVSFQPRKPRNGNVVRAAPLQGMAVLALGEHPACGAGTVSVDDLAVTADAAQLYLVHRPTGRRVIPVISHALDLKVQTPPLARFIAEVATARSAGFGPLDLGAARVLPYVPRIRHRRTILSPARWLLPPSLAKDGTASAAGLLASWRRAWRLPSRVVLAEGELRLPLNLDQPLDRSLLLSRLERPGRVELREDGPAGGEEWLGRPSELLIPLVLRDPAPRPLPVLGSPGRPQRPGGSRVVCARITGNPARFDDIIAVHLPALMARLGQGLVSRWWVRRHRDLIHPSAPEHVEVCLRLAGPAGFAVAVEGLSSFAADLSARGLPGELALASYTEYPARYGHGPALLAAEEVFALDTAAAVAQIALSSAGAVDGQALAAASMARLAAAFAPGPSTGYRALTSCLEQGSGLLDRRVRSQACELADPASGSGALRSLPGGAEVAAAWSSRDTALASYWSLRASQRDPSAVLRTLLHEHQVRALGLGPEAEVLTGRYARAACLRLLALESRA